MTIILALFLIVKNTVIFNMINRAKQKHIYKATNSKNYLVCPYFLVWISTYSPYRIKFREVLQKSDPSNKSDECSAVCHDVAQTLRV